MYVNVLNINACQIYFKYQGMSVLSFMQERAGHCENM